MTSGLCHIVLRWHKIIISTFQVVFMRGLWHAQRANDMHALMWALFHRLSMYWQCLYDRMVSYHILYKRAGHIQGAHIHLSYHIIWFLMKGFNTHIGLHELVHMHVHGHINLTAWTLSMSSKQFVVADSTNLHTHTWSFLYYYWQLFISIDTEKQLLLVHIILTSIVGV